MTNPTATYDFADILFSGACNARCPFCIGKQLPAALTPNNLSQYPPRNLETFINLVRQHAIGEIIFSGTNTDPQCYRHEARLLAYLRAALPSNTRFSLHTNGLLALRKMDTFNAYDRVTLSYPSFENTTYQTLMGTRPPDLVAILKDARVPVKLSCILADANARELPAYLRNCAALGVTRVALRKLVGEQRDWYTLLPNELRLAPQSTYRANPILVYAGVQVTLWDFATTQSRAVHLFASGHISETYRLNESGIPC
ncbi:MAG: hypothetical protein OHK0052_05170 [Anaerolineales bacterium]